MQPNTETHDQVHQYKTLRCSTQGEVDEQLTKLANEGYRLVQATADTGALWIILSRTSWIPKAVQPISVASGGPVSLTPG